MEDIVKHYFDSKDIRIFPVSSPRVTEIGGGRTFYEGKVAQLISSLVDNKSFIVDANTTDDVWHIECVLSGRFVSFNISTADLRSMTHTSTIEANRYIYAKLNELQFDVSSDINKYGNINVSYTDGTDVMPVVSSGYSTYTGVYLYSHHNGPEDHEDSSALCVVEITDKDELVVPEGSYIKFLERSLTFPVIDGIDGKR